MNVVNGGAHADNTIDFQEFMIVPKKFPSFREALRAGVETFHTLKSILKKKGYSTNVGDEGGFAPNLKTIDEVLDTLMEAIEKAGYAGRSSSRSTSRRASSGTREVRLQEVRQVGEDERRDGDDVREAVREVPDRVDRGRPGRERLGGLEEAHGAARKKTQLVGDDLFVTNTEILRKGIKEGIANAILIKVNQIGTITETVNAVLMAQEAKYGAMMSHRSGETEDSTIADLAVALNTGMIKTGLASRRTAWRSTTSFCALKRSLVSRAKFPRVGSQETGSRRGVPLLQSSPEGRDLPFS
jgi:enolase